MEDDKKMPGKSGKKVKVVKELSEEEEFNIFERDMRIRLFKIAPTTLNGDKLRFWAIDNRRAIHKAGYKRSAFLDERILVYDEFRDKFFTNSVYELWQFCTIALPGYREVQLNPFISLILSRLQTIVEPFSAERRAKDVEVGCLFTRSAKHEQVPKGTDKQPSDFAKVGTSTTVKKTRKVALKAENTNSPQEQHVYHSSLRKSPCSSPPHKVRKCDSDYSDVPSSLLLDEDYAECEEQVKGIKQEHLDEFQHLRVHNKNVGHENYFEQDEKKEESDNGMQFDAAYCKWELKQAIIKTIASKISHFAQFAGYDETVAQALTLTAINEIHDEVFAFDKRK